jgi:hypothetical protein
LERQIFGADASLSLLIPKGYDPNPKLYGTGLGGPLMMLA